MFLVHIGIIAMTLILCPQSWIKLQKDSNDVILVLKDLWHSANRKHIKAYKHSKKNERVNRFESTQVI